jgi:Uma2 family endonuclease
MERRLDRLSVADYLEQESRSTIRHEYLDGETFPLADGSHRHKLIVSNLQRRAQAAVTPDRPCRVFGSHIRVHVRGRNCFYYPDLSASTNPNDRDVPYVSWPCLVVEVLSPSTALADRREKRVQYASIPSMTQYVVIDQDRMRVNVFPRGESNCMVRTSNEPDDMLELTCLGLQMRLRDIYMGVVFSGSDSDL